MTASTPSGTQADPPVVDVRDMIVVHTAMLREFRLVPAAVRRTATTDHHHAQVVAEHIRFLCDLLHHHHQGEDELLWPKLRERTPGSAQPVIDEVEAQHEDIDASLDSVEQLRSAWADDPDADRREQLANALERLHVVLRDHLDLEERSLLPLAATVLTTQEWQAVGTAGAASIPKKAMPLVFGMFAYEGDPEVLTDMLKSAPLPVRILVPRVAPGVYARRAQLVHGTTRP